jgi:hypothetical protein
MVEQDFELYLSIPAKPTQYRGRHFRSRTEARWAIFFDEMEILYQFEREHSPQPWAVGQKNPPALIESSKTGDVIHPSPVTRLLRPDWPSRRRVLWYLPDFYLPKQDLYLEIKPLIYHKGKQVLPPMQKQRGLTEHHQVEIITLCGGPSELVRDASGNPPFLGLDNRLKQYTLWTRCSVCSSVILSMEDSADCRNCWEMEKPSRDPEIQQALRTARLWLFEADLGGG